MLLPKIIKRIQIAYQGGVTRKVRFRNWYYIWSSPLYIRGILLYNSCFEYNVDIMSSSEPGLQDLPTRLELTPRAYGVEVCPDKSNIFVILFQSDNIYINKFNSINLYSNSDTFPVIHCTITKLTMTTVSS